MTYSPTNIHSTIGPLLIRGINDIYKKREPKLLEVLSKKVAMPTRGSVGCDDGSFSFPKECL